MAELLKLYPTHSKNSLGAGEPAMHLDWDTLPAIRAADQAYSQPQAVALLETARVKRLARQIKAQIILMQNEFSRVAHDGTGWFGLDPHEEPGLQDGFN